MKKTNTLEYQRDERRIHWVVYHLIWCPRRRKPVLVADVAARCQELIESICAEHGWEIFSLFIQPTYVHLFVRVWPTNSPADVIKACKGITSLHLPREYPELRKLPSMWTRSYFASTAANVSQETVQRYIDAQKGS